WEGANNSWKLYSTISKLKGVDYIIDSSKHAKRMKVLYLRKPRSTRIIHLVRDGRALAHTYKRGGSSVIDAAHQWVRITQNILIMLKGVPRDRWRRVYYEDLCRQPAETIGQLLSWVGLESESDMYEPHGGEYHLIPGNQLIFEGISSIKLKEDWREGLSGREKAEFESIAGSLLKSLGYL
ncbi:MAG: sulfotransferase, partial [Verrucomicrobiota bacterium]